MKPWVSGGMLSGCPVPPMMSSVVASVNIDAIVEVSANSTAPTRANKTTKNERTTTRIRTLPDDAVMKLGSREPSPDSREPNFITASSGRVRMRVVVRSFLVVLLALVGAVLLALTSTMASMFTLATTELIMGGTGHPLSIPPDTQGFITDYITSANNNYIVPSGSCTANCTSTAVYTPEQFRFDTGLTDMTFDQSVAVGQANLDNCIHGNA